MNPKDCPRRRRADRLFAEHPGDDPLRQLVAEAVGLALDRRWRQMVATSVVVAVLASLAISLPLTFTQNAQTNRAAAVHASHNCRLITTIAAVMGSGDKRDRELRRGGFISTDAALSPRSASLDRSTARYWRRVLIPRLLGAARADCTF